MERDKEVHTPAGGVRIIGAESMTDDRPLVDLDLTEISESADMPHWTEPATGQVPRVLSEIDAPSAEDELATGPVWRDDHTGWEDEDMDEPVVPTQERERHKSRRARQDRSVTISSRLTQAAQPFDGEKISAEVIMNTRIVTGAGLIAIAAVAFLLGPAALVVVATLAGLAATFELYQAMRHLGLKPAIPVGALAFVGLQASAYSRGEVAIPVVLAIAVMATLIWFLVGASHGRPSVSTAVTVSGFMYPGLLIAFAPLMLRAPEHRGVALLFGAVFVTAVYDSAAFIVGKQVGRRPLSSVSPGKTMEGLMGGTLGAIIAGVIIGLLMHPWSLGTGLALAVVVAIAAPVGDLCESMLKRDFGIKDMGGILPGHGGFMDRLDSLLFVVPAVYFLAHIANII